MQVEIWSDVMCPFCYIGKRRFEAALEQFDNKHDIEIVWKSFQLNPDMVTDPGKNIDQYLAEAKGWSLKQAQDANAYVTNMAKEAGLTYHMDKAVVANSFDAHRLSHLAKKHGVQDQVEEMIFAAYFTEGKNTADHETLVAIGTKAGLAEAEIRTMLAGNDYAQEVEHDVYEAQQIGVRGVPFFVFDRKYAVSGAQESSAFLQALSRSYAETTKLTNLSDGAVCGPDGCTPEGN